MASTASQPNGHTASQTNGYPKPLEPTATKRPLQAPFNSSSRIAIIGAGPAGVSMAYTLQQRGYHNVVVFEKEDQVGGMTRTVWDEDHLSNDSQKVRTVPHEMGTCYLATYRHRHILDLMDKVHLSRLNLASMEIVMDEPGWGKKLPFEQWAGQLLGKLMMENPTDPKFRFPIDPHDPAGSAKRVEALVTERLNRYLQLRADLFKDADKSYLFPRERPDDATLQELGKSAYDWLYENDLMVLLPVFTQSQTSQGYGYLKDTPVYYLLMWNNSELLGYPSILAQKVVAAACAPGKRQETSEKFPFLFAALTRLEAATAKRVSDMPADQFVAKNVKSDSIGANYRALIVQDGFQQLWTRLAQQLNVRTGVRKLHIKRQKTAKPQAPVVIRFQQDGEEQCMVFDFLMLTVKYDEINAKGGDLDMELTPAEKGVFGKVKNLELTTTVFSCSGGLQPVPQAFMLDLLLDSKDINRCYGTRTSIACVRPGLSYGNKRDSRVAYQVTEVKKTAEELQKIFMADLAKYGAQDVQLTKVAADSTSSGNPNGANPKRWKYMPHFEGEDIGSLWDLWAMQRNDDDGGQHPENDNNTWYLGSLTCFESSADVYSYNVQLCDYFQVGGASVGQGY